jgi:type I restriction-modification system DNA methylase subunit
MIKGIYNENEFYTNFYWDNKFLDDLRSKLGDGTSSLATVTALKGFDGLYWELKESSSNAALKDNLTQFYSALFRVLGYSPKIHDRQSSDGSTVSVFVDEKKGSQSELLAIVTDQFESGSFETIPAFFGDSLPSDLKIYDQTLSDLIQEEFQESQTPPRWILVGSSNGLFLLERSKWSFGRFIKIDWQEIFLQRDQKPYELIYGLFASSVLCPNAGNSIHDEFDDNSHRHAFEVTTELRENVREAIELLINEMIDLRKESHQKIYSGEIGDIYAKELTHDALYYVYRLLFLLFLEAQGDDSELLPLKSEIYRYGYSLEKLLELDFVQIQPDSLEAKGTFIYESLDKIFELIFVGFEPSPKEGLLKRDLNATGFLVKGIKSDLFDPMKIKHLKDVKLRNGTLHEILKKLSLTRPRKKNERVTRVSYSNLGINQLGAVYEGLLSYSGFFAQEDLYALKPTGLKQTDIDNGKELDQIYLAPKSIVERYRKPSERKYKLSDDNVVLDQIGNPKIYKKGSFVYRLAGRDRQKLASYYTPESLTKCTVKYSLEILFQTKQKLEDLWNLKILEPAMGSGAFLNEAVNQLANKILELEIDTRVKELKTPGEKQKRIWEIKYQLIANNVYGVDLNPTAIELARFSLWLNCIGAGKEPPSFENRLKVGNSLIGARFTKGADGIYPWLLLDDGVMNYGKKLKEYNLEGSKSLHDFRKKLLDSRLESSHPKVRALQSRAESTLEKLISTQSTASNRNPAYDRLKLCADLWCSLYFLDIDDLSFFPANHESLCDVFISIMESGAIDTSLQNRVDRISKQENFFHWEIEYPEILFKSGFDLIFGNPPWVAVDWQDSLYLSDYNVIPAVLELNAAQTREYISVLSNSNINTSLGQQFIRYSGYSSLLEVGFYDVLRGVQKNTYKAFDVLAIFLMGNKSVTGLIHEDGIYDDDKAAILRSQLYKYLRFHFQFQNENKLFSEVHNAKRYSVNIFQKANSSSIKFEHIGNLFLPTTIDQCFSDSGIEDVPLIKRSDGQWETKGHKNRIICIEENVLRVFSKFNNSENFLETPLLNLHSTELLTAIEKIGSCDETLQVYFGKDGFIGSSMLHESGSQDDGLIESSNGRAKTASGCILSGPNIGPANPLLQETRQEYVSNKSYDSINLDNFGDQFLPRTLYKYKRKPTNTDVPSFGGIPYWNFYRIATRAMVNAANERTLFACILPPGVAHINGINSVAVSKLPQLAIASGLCASIVYDGIIKIQNKSNIFPADVVGLPLPKKTNFFHSIGRRSLCLNALTEEYADLWKGCETFSREDNLVTGEPISNFDKKWSRERPLRESKCRTQALLEIDVLTALSLDLTFDELRLLYEILFPVLSKYDRQSDFDRIGKMREAFKYFTSRDW